MQLEARWRLASQVVADTRDIIDERAQADAPGWAVARGWVPFLSGLPEVELRRCEVEGLAPHAARLGAPADLVALAEACQAVVALPSLEAAGPAAPRHRVGARKRQQVAAFAAAVQPRAAAVSRVVDVGAGHGHLTRHLVEALQLDEGLGLEINPAHVRAARALADDRLTFATVDLFAGPPALRADDLVVGLHACGELSDRLVQHAAAAGADVAYASCCMQKRTDRARAPLAGGPAALAVPRVALGLANIAVGAVGVEASLAANVAARARRAGLRHLLRARGVRVDRAGDEMRGLNRRRAQGAFADLVAAALGARALAPASAAEIAASAAAGAAESAHMRRWTVARRMLGRVLEVQINLDRAMYLAQRDYTVRLGTLWPSRVSPRNVGVVAHR